MSYIELIKNQNRKTKELASNPNQKKIDKVISLVAKAATAKNPYAKKDTDGFFYDITTLLTTPSVLLSDKKFKTAASALKKAHGVDLIAKIKNFEQTQQNVSNASKSKATSANALAKKIEKLKQDPKVKEYLKAVADLRKTK